MRACVRACVRACLLASKPASVCVGPRGAFCTSVCVCSCARPCIVGVTKVTTISFYVLLGPTVVEQQCG